MNKKVKVCLAQMEVLPANPLQNTNNMLVAIQQAKEDKADLIVFSELCIPGYLIGDLWEHIAFLRECQECQDKIVQASQDITVIFGNITIDPNAKNEDGRIRKFNSAIIAKDQKVASVVVKTLQPNYREFEDNRHFYDARKYITDSYMLCADYASQFGLREPSYADWVDSYYSPKLIINDINIGVMLCEDAWDTDYSFSPYEAMIKKCDMVINISCSPYTMGKNNKRNRVFGGHAAKYKKPMVYVNNVGIQNNGKTIYTFDGNSCIYDLNGNQLNPFKPFSEGTQTFEISMDQPFGNSDYEEDTSIAIIHDSLVYGMRKFCEQFGIERVVIGASGGIDSSVVSALFSEFLPPENMLLVNMPSRFNSDLTKDAAKKLADNIGCRYIVHPIQNSVDNTALEIGQANRVVIDKDNRNIVTFPWGEPDLSPFIIENVQARDRSSRVLAAWAAWFKGVFTCNANKSEASVGYGTLEGDMRGFLMPIGDLWKTQVYELAKYINHIKNNIIPIESINVKPSAELSPNQDVTKGLGDPLIYPYHDKLFASWIERWNRATPEDILYWYINGILEKEIGYEGKISDLFQTDDLFISDLEKWWNLYAGFAVAKRIQSQPVIGVSRRICGGYDIRESQLKPYYTQRYFALKNFILKKEK